MKKILTLSFLLASFMMLYCIPPSDGFDYPVSNLTTPTEAQDGDGWYNALDYLEYYQDHGWHLGEDWNLDSGGNSDLGQPVYAASTGTVVYSNWGGASWGNVIVIRHQLSDGSLVETLYGHLDTRLVSVNTDVSRRTQIGTIGTAGIYYAHLHFSLRFPNCGTNNWGLPGIGYTSNQNIVGFTDPSDWIDQHRPNSQIAIVNQYPLSVSAARVNPPTMYFIPNEYSSTPGDGDKNLLISFRLTNSGSQAITLQNFGVEVRTDNSSGNTCFYLNHFDSDGTLSIAPGEVIPFNRLAYLTDEFMQNNSARFFWARVTYKQNGTWTQVPGTSAITTFQVQPRPPLNNEIRLVKSPQSPVIWLQQYGLRWAVNSAPDAALVSPTWEDEYYIYPNALVQGLASDHPQNSSILATIVGRNLVWKGSTPQVYIIEPDPVYNNQLRSRWFETSEAFNDYGFTYSLAFNSVEFSASSVNSILQTYPYGSTITSTNFAPPSNLTATAGTSSVALSWTAPTGYSGTLAGYRVYRNGAVYVNSVMQTSYTDNSVTQGTTYTYHVTALYTSPTGESQASNTATVTIQATNFAPPSNLTATAGTSSVAISWTAPTGYSGTLAGYRVYRNGAVYVNSVMQTSYTDNSVTQGTTYTYHVTALYTSPTGESQASNTVTVTVTGANENIIQNAGFETGNTSQWQINNSLNADFTVITNDVVEGNYAGKITVPTPGQSWDCEMYQLVPITAGAIYNVSFYTRANQNTSLVLTVQNNQYPYNSYGMYTSLSATTQWQKHQFCFEATATDGQARFNIQSGLTSGFVLFDKIEMTEIDEPEAIPGNSFLNPSFEQHFYPWAMLDLSGNALYYIDDSTSSSGLSSMYINTTYSGLAYYVQLYQVVDVQAGVNYTVSFKAKSSIPRTIITEAQSHTPPNPNLGLWQEVLISTVWQTYSVTFVSNQAGSARIAFELGDSASQVWFDEMCLSTSTAVTEHELSQPCVNLSVYPNPFRDQASIKITDADKDLSLEVFNIKGQKVATCTRVDKGEYIWDGNISTGIPAAPGVYFIKARGISKLTAKKVIKID